MSDERRCQVCNEIVAPHWTSDRQQEDGWYMNNVAPAAASGGTMRPVHYRCRPLPVLVTKAELDAARAEIARLTEQRDRAMQLHELFQRSVTATILDHATKADAHAVGLWFETPEAADEFLREITWTAEDIATADAKAEKMAQAFAALDPEAAAEPEGT